MPRELRIIHRKITITVLSFLFVTLPAPVHACGWWGDGEMNREVSAVVTDADGRPIPETLSVETTRLPGRMGYGIAVLNPGRAVPYLQQTHGRPINRIGELETFGFNTVIDLGTPHGTAQLHRAETETVGMHYINIPVIGVMPDHDQIKRFSLTVFRSSGDPLLVYAPTSTLLGTMWASHRINLGAPLEFAIREGKSLSMGSDQEAQIRDRLKRLEE